MISSNHSGERVPPQRASSPPRKGARLHETGDQPPGNTNPAGSFRTALERFCACTTVSVGEPRRSRVEQTMVRDLRAEAARDGETRRKPRIALGLTCGVLKFPRIAELIDWADSEDDAPSAAQIRERYAVSDATSYRWAAALRQRREAL